MDALGTILMSLYDTAGTSSGYVALNRVEKWFIMFIVCQLSNLNRSVRNSLALHFEKKKAKQ